MPSRPACSIACGATWNWATAPEDVRAGPRLCAADSEGEAAAGHHGLHQRGAARRPVAAVGYCWGGTLAYLAACELPVRAAVSYYGTRIVQHAGPQARARRCSTTSASRTRPFRRRASRRSAPRDPAGEFHVYPADHGFNCDQRASFDAAVGEAGARAHAGVPRAHLRRADDELQLTSGAMPSYSASPAYPRRGPVQVRRAAGQFRHAGFADRRRRAQLPAAPAARPPHHRGAARDLVLDPVLHHPAAAARCACCPSIVACGPSAARRCCCTRWRCATHCARTSRDGTANRSPVELGMLYSTPDVAQGLAALRAAGAQRIVVLPLFPQYSGTTNAAALDQVGTRTARLALRARAALRCRTTAVEPRYIAALATSVRAHWQQQRRRRSPADDLPRHSRSSTCEEGDPYQRKCERDGAGAGRSAGLDGRHWTPELPVARGPRRMAASPTPTTVIGELARARRAATGCDLPGIRGGLPRDHRRDRPRGRCAVPRAGGETLRYIPALNAGAAQVGPDRALLCRR